MNRDAAISNPQAWNLYAYCENNPVTKMDPDGRDILDDIIAAGNRFMSRQGISMVPNATYIDGQVSTTVPSLNKTAKGAAVVVVVGAAVVKAAKAKEAGKVYRVEGDRTPSGKPYVGRTKQSSPEARGDRDGRDRTGATVVDTYDANDNAAARQAEQRAMNQEGGVENLDNKRNEIRPENWEDNEIPPPSK